jgi:ornithine carbamoyltransferase
VWVGDGNNVARSLAHLCKHMGMHLTLASPAGYELPDAQSLGAKQLRDPKEAVADADAVFTDTFVSMGQEDEKRQRLAAFADYQLNDQLLGGAPAHAVVLHCLPAYRGVEITDSVLDGPRSRVFPEAHNRLHAQKGLLALILAP